MKNNDFKIRYVKSNDNRDCLVLFSDTKQVPIVIDSEMSVEDFMAYVQYAANALRLHSE